MSKQTKKIDDGGTAFPSPENTKEGWAAEYGMSLRDWFAGMALNGLVERGGYDLEHSKFQDTVKHLAVNAYILADAMIAERNKRTEDC